MSVPSTEVRRAWEQHDPSRRHPRIGPEQRGLLRAFKNSLAPAARLVDVIRSDTYRRARDDYAFKKGIGRSRALARLNHQLVPPAILMAKNEDAAIWSWLKAGGPVIADSEDPGHAQDCVLVYVAISGRSNDGQAATAGAWTLEMPDHALGRLLQYRRGINLTDAIWEAHRALMGASIQDFIKSFERGQFHLPVAGGMFVCEPISGHGNGMRLLYTRVRTFLSEPEPWRRPIAPATGADDAPLVQTLFERLDDDAI